MGKESASEAIFSQMNACMHREECRKQSGRTKELEAEKAEMEGEYVEREGILSVKVDRMQIEIDMLRRIRKRFRVENKKLRDALKEIGRIAEHPPVDELILKKVKDATKQQDPTE